MNTHSNTNLSLKHLFHECNIRSLFSRAAVVRLVFVAMFLLSSLATGHIAQAGTSTPGSTTADGELEDLQNDTNAVYPLTIAPLVTSQVAKLLASDGEAGDNLGYEAVAIDGDTMVVGAWQDHVGLEDDQGSAYVFERNWGGADNWGQVAKLTASDGMATDWFGRDVAIDGDTIVVGASANDVAAIGQDEGGAWVFERNQGGADNWGEVAQLTASDYAFADYFGRDVAISGDTIIVGAWGDDAPLNSGSAYIFERNLGGADNWGEATKLTASDAFGGDWFGYFVDISGDTLIVGALFDDAPNNSGAAYVFERNLGGADNWGEAAKLKASDAFVSDQFGRSVSIDGDTIVVGATLGPGNSVNTGAAYIFERDEGGTDNWGEAAKLTASDGVGSDYFGEYSHIDGDIIVVGARLDDR